jgi:cbb3-type cytochrome oxidase maturation protein
LNLLYLILPLALGIGAGFVAAFVWATRKGQFDDLETPAMRALFDDSEVDQEAGPETRE